MNPMVKDARARSSFNKGAFNWFPVFLLHGIVAWSYYSYVVVMCIKTVENDTERIIYLVLYHLFLLIFLATYWKAILSKAGNPPEAFAMSGDQYLSYKNSGFNQSFLDSVALEVTLLTRTINGGRRFCRLCQALKPDRSHHCSSCGQCILKMDHHCPWVNNCVGWGNHKYFILFLWYSSMYTLYCSVTVLKYFIMFWTGDIMQEDKNLNLPILFFTAVIFTGCLWALFGFHITLVVGNRTTLEHSRPAIFQHGPDKFGFFIGPMANIQQVFGHVKWKWFLPIFTTPGNGTFFPMRGGHHMV